MDLLENVYKELEGLDLTKREDIYLKEIYNKDGIFLYRIEYLNQFYVMKYFTDNESAREIRNYSILMELNIPTMKSFGCTDKSILLEDIDKSSDYRLGTAVDLSDIEVAKALIEYRGK